MFFPPLKINLTIACLRLNPFHLIFTLAERSDSARPPVLHTAEDGAVQLRGCACVHAFCLLLLLQVWGTPREAEISTRAQDS